MNPKQLKTIVKENSLSAANPSCRVRLGEKNPPSREMYYEIHFNPDSQINQNLPAYFVVNTTVAQRRERKTHTAVYGVQPFKVINHDGDLTEVEDSTFYAFQKENKTIIRRGFNKEVDKLKELMAKDPYKSNYSVEITDDNVLIVACFNSKLQKYECFVIDKNKKVAGTEDFYIANKINPKTGMAYTQELAVKLLYADQYKFIQHIPGINVRKKLAQLSDEKPSLIVEDFHIIRQLVKGKPLFFAVKENTFPNGKNSCTPAFLIDEESGLIDASNPWFDYQTKIDDNDVIDTALSKRILSSNRKKILENAKKQCPVFTTSLPVISGQIVHIICSPQPFSSTVSDELSDDARKIVDNSCDVRRIIDSLTKDNPYAKYRSLLFCLNLDADDKTPPYFVLDTAKPHLDINSEDCYRAYPLLKDENKMSQNPWFGYFENGAVKFEQLDPNLKLHNFQAEIQQIENAVKVLKNKEEYLNLLELIIKSGCELDSLKKLNASKEKIYKLSKYIDKLALEEKRLNPDGKIIELTQDELDQLNGNKQITLNILNHVIVRTKLPGQTGYHYFIYNTNPASRANQKLYGFYIANELYTDTGHLHPQKWAVKFDADTNRLSFIKYNSDRLFLDEIKKCAENGNIYEDEDYIYLRYIKNNGDQNYYAVDKKQKLGQGCAATVLKAFPIDPQTGVMDISEENAYVDKLIDSPDIHLEELQNEALLLNEHYPTELQIISAKGESHLLTKYIPGKDIYYHKAATEKVIPTEFTELSLIRKLEVLRETALAYHAFSHNSVKRTAKLHNDLKGNNIRFSIDKDERINVAIIDLNLAIRLPIDNGKDLAAILVETEEIGSDYYRPPEARKGFTSEHVFSLGKRGIKSYIYALGKVFIILLEGIIKSSLPNYLKPYLEPFLRKMKSQNYESRPDSDETLKFFTTLFIFCKKVEKREEEKIEIKTDVEEAKLAILIVGAWNEVIKSEKQQLSRYHSQDTVDTEETLQVQNQGYNFTFAHFDFESESNAGFCELIVELYHKNLLTKSIASLLGMFYISENEEQCSIRINTLTIKEKLEYLNFLYKDKSVLAPHAFIFNSLEPLLMASIKSDLKQIDVYQDEMKQKKEKGILYNGLQFFGRLTHAFTSTEKADAANLLIETIKDFVIDESTAIANFFADGKFGAGLSEKSRCRAALNDGHLNEYAGEFLAFLNSRKPVIENKLEASMPSSSSPRA